MKLTSAGRRTVGVGATLAVVSSIGVLGALPASAAPGDASATAVDIDLGAELLGTLALDTDVTVGTATAPTTVGTSSPTVADLDLTALGIVANADVVGVTATRGVGTSSASASVADVNVDLFGLDAVTAGAVTSEAVCVAGSPGVATTGVADLLVLGTAVPLASLAVNTPTVVAGVDLSLAGFVGVELAASVERVEQESAGGAVAAAVEVTFSLEGEGLPETLVAGTVTLAESSCETPTAIPALTVTDITPDEGPQAGGTEVTITGTGFVPGATTVTFDGVPATDVDVVDADDDGVGESLTAVSPAGEVGDAVVVVGNTIGTAELGFTYLADGSDAVVATVAPTTGPTSGGTVVTITGSGLDGATGVTVGGEPGTDVVVNEAGTQITVTTPASDATGPVPVVVQFPGGTASAGEFTYVAPEVWNVLPSQGPVAGGTEVEILGSGLDAATGVLFDGEPATSLTVVPGAVRVTTPPGTAGLVDVVVQLPGVDAVVEDGFFYRAPGTAELLSLDPEAGETSGGTEVTITGTDLAGTTAVTFDGAPATIVAGPTETTVVVRTPAGDAGPADVAVTNDAGVSVLPNGFTYLDDGAGAVVTAVEPGTLPTAGGTPVTVTGSDLDGAVGVVFDAVPGTDVVVSDDGTTITVLAPPSQDAGDVEVAVVFPGGQVPAGTVTYVAPTIGTLSPADGPVAGGTLVTIPGTDLGGTTEVLFDGVPGTELTVAPDGLSLTVRTPAGEAGPADVVVVQPGADASAADGFTYRVVPVVESIAPESGPTAGGQTVLVTGSGFEPGTTTVTFDGVAATNVQVLTPAILTAVTPAHDAGSVDVVVTVGTVASAPLAYLFDAAAAPVPPAPVVTGVTPPAGSTGGGTSVVVTGENLVPGSTSVVICDVLVPASAVTVDPSGTRAVFLTPPCAAGQQEFTLVSPGGTATGAFLYMEVPVRTSFPVGGPSSGSGAPGYGTSGGQLARTGAGAAPLVGMSLGLLLAGAAAAVVARRETQDGQV